MKYINKIAILLMLAAFLLSDPVFSAGQDDEQKPGFDLTAAENQTSSVQTLTHNPEHSAHNSGGNIAWGHNTWTHELFSTEISSTRVSAENDIPVCDGKQIISSSDSWPDSITKSTMNEHHPFSISKGKPGGVSPNATDNETLRHDNGTNFTAIGSSEGVIYAAAYFPASTMQQHTGKKLKSGEIYIGQNPISVMLMVYGPGSNGSPGDTIHTQTVATTANSWNMIELSSPVSITGEDLWIGYVVVHDSGSYPAGVDAGPAVAGFGDMVSEDGQTWGSLYDYGLDFNWNIAGYLEDGGVQANAGPDDAICEELPYYLEGASAVNYSFLHWTTNGDGFFDDETLLNPTYTPEAMDIAAGVVELCITASSSDGSVVTDCMLLTIQSPPTADAGADATISQWVSWQLSGTVQNSSNILWTSSGTGTFSPPNVLNPQYSPSADDILAGAVQLCLTAQAAAPCNDAIDCMTLTIQADPTVNAGNDTTICVDPAKGNGSKLCFQLNATATNSSDLQWIAINGFGDFSNENVLNPCYNISPFDILQDSVVLCLSAAPKPPATTYGNDCMVLYFQQYPIVSAGPDITITLTKTNNNPLLENGSIVLGGFATNYSSLLWTSTGDGTFDDTTILSPSYTYSQGDMANDSIQLCLNAQPINPCTTVATDCMVLTFEQEPFVDAGPDTTICVNPSKKTPGGKGCFPLNGTASGYTDLLWTTNGTGYFDNAQSLSPCYYYSPDDILSGSVELGLAINYKGAKSSLDDSMILTFQESPTVDAGANASITAGMAYTNPDAIATNFSSLHWTTTGDGTFDNTANLNPTYTPGTNDQSNGSVTFCLDALAISPCQVSANDCMDLSITTLPTGIDFGDAPEMGGILFSFPTTLANGGAAHVINPNVFLGNKIDGEPDGQPTVGADGDDNDILYPSLGDDEDGVILPASVFAGTTVTISVKASVAGYLDAWMDFDLDNTWFNPMEHIFTMQPLVAGNNMLTFIVPAIAVPGQSYLRFRFRDDADPLSFNGFANNGEVEDYTVVIKENTIEGWDFGDAPQDDDLYAYPTLLSDDGARHYFVPGIYLGTLIDIEPDGQPTPAADGDDTDKYYPGLGDDEDGVTLPAAVSPGAVTTIQVQASVSGFLDAWMDFDLDGTWSGANEHIFTIRPLNPGANNLTFNIPSAAVAGQSFLRFRFRNNAASLTFNGPADNGEVEDYAMQIALTPGNGWDFGDAPDGIGSKLFPTLLNNNGARHTIVPGIQLGNIVDTEPDGQPDLAATGDDIDLVYPSSGDDEDGVTFTSQLISGSTATITVASSVDGYLDAWMDFNADGQWTAAAEHIFTSVPVTAVTNNLSFNIPTSAMPGTSYMRFRFRDYDNPLNYYGACENGEVEDYRVEIMDGSIPQMDFGDAPESTQPFLLSYPTTLAHNGAAHIIDPAVHLGYLIDAEPDGQPNAAADGDDNNDDMDEDGLSDDDMEAVVPGSTVTIEVIASVDGYLDAWMDFDLDNTWLAPNEHIFDMQALVAGLNTLTFDVPAEAVAGQSYLRLRFRDYAGPLSFGGIANNGEVEDYSIQIEQGQATGMDFGDAPDTPYPTLLASDGARHIDDGATRLGYIIDVELDGLQSADGKGDDLNYVDDEDGVNFVNTMYAGGVATLQIVAYVDGFLNAWMDFDRNGSWAEAGDQVFTDEWLTAGVNTLSFTIPASASMGNTFTRFRFASQAGLTFTGLVQDGEVEDYQVSVYPSWSVTPTFNTHIISVPTGIPPLQAGDMLGVFFINDNGQEQCGGTMLYNGQANQLLAYGDDEFTPDVKEGFATGEMINWKLFSATSGSVENVEVDYDQSYPDNDGTFRPFGFSALTAVNYITNLCGLPPGWEFTVTGQVHSINIPLAANPNIFGEPLQMGDWIGVFYYRNGCCDDDCGGGGQWNGSSLVINAYGDDPFTPEKDGFAEGEQLMWKIYDCDGTEEFSAQATYNPIMPCEGNFGDLCLSELLSLEAAYFQNYSFSEGWNSMSTYLVPIDPDVENMLAANINETIILKNLTSLYWAYAGVNTIGNWDNESGYAIKVFEGFDMQIAGTEFTPTAITLAAGWHYLPVLSTCDVDADELFGPHANEISIVMDLIGTKVWWSGANVFTLDFLEPGKAYKIRLIEEVTLNFPACDFKSQSILSQVQNSIASPWGNINMTPTNHVVSIMADAMIDMDEGDFIGAFDQAGALCGVVEIANTSRNNVIVLFGDDPTTEIKDGFVEAEPIEFRLMDISTSKEALLDVSFDLSMPNVEQVFANNGLSAISNTNLTGLEDLLGLGSKINIYPNPSTGLVYIDGLEEGSSIKIFNAFGEEVKQFEKLSSNNFDLSNQPKGVYFIRIESEAGNYFEKIILN